MMDRGAARSLRSLDPGHPFLGIVETTAQANPSDAMAIFTAAGDWVPRAWATATDPLDLQPRDLEAILRRRADGTGARRRIGLCLLWDALDPSDAEHADPIAVLRPFDRPGVQAMRLLPEQHEAVLACCVRDLRDPARRLAAARDLLAIGLLAHHVCGLRTMGSLRRHHLTSDGSLAIGEGGEVVLTDDMLTRERLLRWYLEAEIGLLRPSDALLPTVGTAAMAMRWRRTRPDLTPVPFASLRGSLSDRLRRVGLDVPHGHIRYVAMSWFSGIGAGEIRLPAGLARDLERASSRAPA